MKSILASSIVVTALALNAQAYVAVEEGAFNVRHIHMVERSEGGEIVGRAFGNTYDIVRRDDSDLEARGRCTTVLACGTAGGCATMAGQRYCKGESWEKSFQKAVSQTGANGITGLKMMAEGIGRGPAGMIAGMAKSTAKALIDAKKEKKAKAPKQDKKAPKKHSAPKSKTSKPAKSKPAKSKSSKPAKTNAKGSKNKKHKRSLEDEELVLNRRDFEVVERDENMDFVQRSEYSTFDLVSRDEDGTIVSRQCEMYNGDVSCM